MSCFTTQLTISMFLRVSGSVQDVSSRARSNEAYFVFASPTAMPLRYTSVMVMTGLFAAQPTMPPAPPTGVLLPPMVSLVDVFAVSVMGVAFPSAWMAVSPSVSVLGCFAVFVPMETLLNVSVTVPSLTCPINPPLLAPFSLTLSPLGAMVTSEMVKVLTCVEFVPYLSNCTSFKRPISPPVETLPLGALTVVAPYILMLSTLKVPPSVVLMLPTIPPKPALKSVMFAFTDDAVTDVVPFIVMLLMDKLLTLWMEPRMPP